MIRVIPICVCVLLYVFHIDGGESGNGGQRRPSIANLLRQRIQRSVRSRIEERDKSDQFRNDLIKSVAIPRLVS